MAPKKKFRNNKAKKNEEDNPRPKPTVPCQNCGEPITVPQTCKHGKKLINCQGTGCTRAHIQEHSVNCKALVAPIRSKAPMGLSEIEATSELNDPKVHEAGNIDRTTASVIMTKELNERKRLREQSLANMSLTRLAAMGVLMQQVNAIVRLRGGKPTKYIEGLPFKEWLSKVEKGPIMFVDEWIEKFKDVVEGKQTLEAIGYDDEESEADEEACPTPDDDDDSMKVDFFR
jgi:hypothetical protein